MANEAPTYDSPTTAPFLTALENRHSIYQLTPQDTPVPNARLPALCTQVLLHTPTAFNTQHVRIQLLLDEQHARFWDIAAEKVRKTVPEAGWPAFLPRIEMFRGAQGSAVFWDAPEAMGAIGRERPVVKDLLPEWTEHAQGMHHLALWTLLESEGLGANLQHYSMIEDEARAEWKIPRSWKIKAQLVFGKGLAPPRPRQYNEVEGVRLMIYGLEGWVDGDKVDAPEGEAR